MKKYLFGSLILLCSGFVLFLIMIFSMIFSTILLNGGIFIACINIGFALILSWIAFKLLKNIYSSNFFKNLLISFIPIIIILILMRVIQNNLTHEQVITFIKNKSTFTNFEITFYLLKTSCQFSIIAYIIINIIGFLNKKRT